MNAQVFRGRTVADARRVAVEKLGPRAVILTTRTVRRTGLGGLLGASDVEIAALPCEAPVALSEGRKPEGDVPFARGVYIGPTRTADDGIAALRAELKGDIRALKTLVSKVDEQPRVADEIARLRDLVEALSEPKPVRADKVSAQIQALGLEGPAAAALARKMRKAGGAESLRSELASMLAVAPWPLDGEKTVIALVGPSGVGKTTTAAKLAARARAAGRTVCLVACDTYRVGGVAQIAHYADLLGAECLTPKSADELRAILGSNGSDVLIVDTSGRPPTAEGVEMALSTGRKASRSGGRARHVMLCVPAAIRAGDAARVARRFAPLGPTSLAVTKVDETDAPAGILHSTWASKLPVSVVCDGQRVPEDIAAATVDALTRHLTPNDEARPAVS